MSEPTLNDVIQQLQLISNRLGEFEQKVEQRLDKLELHLGEFEQKVEQRLDKLELRFGFLETSFDRIEQRFNTLDNRLSDLSMRQMQVNSSAFFGVRIALLSAAIAFVVARVSGGGP